MYRVRMMNKMEHDMYQTLINRWLIMQEKIGQRIIFGKRTEHPLPKAHTPGQKRLIYRDRKLNNIDRETQN